MRGRVVLFVSSAVGLMLPAHTVDAPGRRALSPWGQDAVATTNDNRTAAGAMVGDTLALRLTIDPAQWRLHGDSNPGFRVAAFAEEGKGPTIPAPLLRVRAGTPVHVRIRNPLDDTLVVRGLSERGGMLDSVVVPPNGEREVRFDARRPGTYQYWGALASAQRRVPAAVRDNGIIRPGYDSQLVGAFIVDSAGPVPDERILVITEVSDQVGTTRRERHGIPGREFTAINGRSWPHSERLTYARGDTVRWRVINTTFQAHPMHLHGFYFRVDARGSVTTGTDTAYAVPDRRMAVTETLAIGQSVSIAWVPEREGGWIFHCHLTNHAVRMPPVDRPDSIEFPAHTGHGDPDDHTLSGMNGLVVGINVTGTVVAARAWRPARRIRLLVQSDSAPGDTLRRFGYVIQRGAEPPRDSVERPGPVLVLTRGEPTSITVVNRSPEPTSVHWHGIELESYYDGAVGWSGTNDQKRAPAIRPESTFDVRLTPKRAGTFMYHTHFNEIRQQYGGLVGALLVLDPGERWDTTRDFVFLLSEAESGRLLVNGSPETTTRATRVGTTYRLRIANVAAYRQNLVARLVRDSTIVSWRPVAKDGFTLSARQSVSRAGIALVASGETADFLITPESPGELRLEVGPRTRAGVFQLQGTVILRVARH